VLGALEADGLRDLCMETHRHAATGDAQALRGIWRRQQAFFETAHPGIPERPSAQKINADMLATLGAMSDWSGKTYSDVELWGAIERVALSICPGSRLSQCAREGATA
jgi:hypothetical protein